MSSTIAAVALACTISATGHSFGAHRHLGGIAPDGPGYGWGFPNGASDHYGYVDYGYFLPLGANRTPNYYFPRYFATPLIQTLPPSYYNAYVTRGQRYLPFSGCGGAHPAGGAPMASADTPFHPYQEAIGAARPVIPAPDYSGQTEAPPIPAGSSGLIP